MNKIFHHNDYQPVNDLNETSPTKHDYESFSHDNVGVALFYNILIGGYD